MRGGLPNCSFPARTSAGSDLTSSPTAKTTSEPAQSWDLSSPGQPSTRDSRQQIETWRRRARTQLIEFCDSETWSLSVQRILADIPFGARVTSCNPSLRRITIAGHQFVRPDWNRFKPTKAVKISHHGLTQWARATDNNTKNPAINRNPRSTVMRVPPMISVPVRIQASRPKDVYVFQPCSTELGQPCATAVLRQLRLPSTRGRAPGR